MDTGWKPESHSLANSLNLFRPNVNQDVSAILYSFDESFKANEIFGKTTAATSGHAGEGRGNTKASVNIGKNRYLLFYT